LMQWIKVDSAMSVRLILVTSYLVLSLLHPAYCEPQHQEKYVLGDYRAGVTWQVAESFCQDIGGQLATLDSEEKQRSIASFIDDNEGYTYMYWIGLTDIDTEGSWQWSTGSPMGSYSNWDDGEPNNWEGGPSEGEDCIILRSDRDYSWNDLDCLETQFGYENIRIICELGTVKDDFYDEMVNRAHEVKELANNRLQDGQSMYSTKKGTTVDGKTVDIMNVISRNRESFGDVIEAEEIEVEVDNGRIVDNKTITIIDEGGNEEIEFDDGERDEWFI